MVHVVEQILANGRPWIGFLANSSPDKYILYKEHIDKGQSPTLKSSQIRNSTIDAKLIRIQSEINEFII